ncbi:CapA family protein [Kitasatospora sp. CM 4170]|uniref:CapA family protein n=1 Tax=Kitasatospora aburaviensis TaxID=67265 RepID=A0ABW1F546_9ACTN|nr:CapA family protein [Kitasatospora sp. CM 4170]WNM49863.1 CapA family protein [Kitasatospora sp. CM 4170]
MRLPRRPAATVAAALLLLTLAGCGGPEAPDSRGAPGASRAPRPDGGGATPAATTASPTGPRAFTLVATGDVLPHTEIIRQAREDAGGDGYDFTRMLAGVKPLISGADLAICHMETVYGADGGPFTGYPSFKSPPQVARALKETGYTGCDTASNHTLDDGPAGIRRTLDAMDAVGLVHTGSARDATEAGRPALLRAGGATVAHLAYTYGTNGIPLPKGQPWAVNLIDRGRILADARAAREGGADLVVVSVHWGTEWQDAPNDQQLTLARELAAGPGGGRSDVDLILGTHAHIPQAYEKIGDTWTVYGLGDQLAGHMFTYDGAEDPRGNWSSIARFTFVPPAGPGQRWTVGKAEFVPQVTDLGPPYRVLDLREAVRRDPGRVDFARALEHIRTIVLSRGAASAGLTMAP